MQFHTCVDLNFIEELDTELFKEVFLIHNSTRENKIHFNFKKGSYANFINNIRRKKEKCKMDEHDSADNFPCSYEELLETKDHEVILVVKLVNGDKNCFDLFLEYINGTTVSMIDIIELILTHEDMRHFASKYTHTLNLQQLNI